MAQSIDMNNFEEHSLAREVSLLYSSWRSGKQKWEERVKETIQYVYATSTRETTNVENGWSHSTHIPKLTQIHDNLGANYASALFGSRDWFKFFAGTADEATKAKQVAIESYLNTKHDWNDFTKVMLSLLNDWVQTGNCFARVEYVIKYADDEKETVKYEGPRVVRISPYDIVFDYTAERFEDSPIIYRKTMTRGELLSIPHSQPELQYDEEEIARLVEMRTFLSDARASDINKITQQQFDGFSSPAQYYKSGQIEILEFIGDIYDEERGELLKNCLITVADRRFVLRKTPLKTTDGRRHIYHAGWRERPDNLWAMGPLDNLVSLQYMIDHLENARADAFDQMLTPDRVFRGNIQTEEDGPITNFYSDDTQGGVENLAPDPTVLNADFQIDKKENQMEAYAGAPREAMGIRTPGEKTKFEVQQLQNAAGRLFQHKIEQFEALVESLLNGELEVAYRNLNSVDVVKTIDDDLGVVAFMEINKEDLTVKGKLKARGASHFAKQSQLVQELQAFGNVLLQDQAMAQHFPADARAKMWADALNMPEGAYQKFGQVAESMEAAELTQAAQSQVDQTQVAVEDTL